MNRRSFGQSLLAGVVTFFVRSYRSRGVDLEPSNTSATSADAQSPVARGFHELRVGDLVQCVSDNVRDWPKGQIRQATGVHPFGGIPGGVFMDRSGQPYTWDGRFKRVYGVTVINMPFEEII